MNNWYIVVDGRQEGPFQENEILAGLESGKYSAANLVWRNGYQDWVPLSQVRSELGRSSQAMPPPPNRGRQIAHEIDYTIHGHEMQFVEIELDPGESAVAEAGSMMYMSDGITMETVFGDGSQQDQQGGMFDKMLGAGKRLITGESLFTTVFTQNGTGKGKVAFASPYPGKIVPMNLPDYGGVMICQKDAFLCAAKGVSIGVEFQKKVGTALFGGEGFIMQRLEGDGLTFVHAGGTILDKELEAGETVRVDTGCLVALTQTVQYDIEFVGGVKSAIFGGEGFFFATVRGPGHVWLQSLPFSRLAGRIHESTPQNVGSTSKGEGSVLGEIGNLFQR